MKENEKSFKEIKLKKCLLWIINKRIYIFSILASILFISIIIYKVKPLVGKKSFEGSFSVYQTYLEWKSTNFKDVEKLNKLKYLIKKYPNLEPKYEGLILQNLLINGKFGKEEYKLANRVLERTKLELPLYYEYSKTAILISSEQYQKALDKSNDLKIKMLDDLSFLEGEGLPAGAVLYSFNLLRIALLEAKLNNTQRELLAWQELEDYLSFDNKSKINDQIKVASNAIKQIFYENGIELKDYIHYRKNSLSSIKS